MNPIVKTLLDRKAVLGKKLEEYPRVHEEYLTVIQTLAHLQKEFPEEFQDVEASAGTVTEQPSVAPPAKPTITNLATRVLGSSPPLHATVLREEIKKGGWKGSGDDHKDTRNISITLGGRPETFVNIGKNTWTLLSKVTIGQPAGTTVGRHGDSS